MLDGKWKHVQDRFWDRLGARVARLGVTADQITLTGTLLLASWCAAYGWHQRPWLFGLGIALIELSDDLDGAVARVTNTASAAGAYLDAVTDRYKECFVYAALAWVHDAWPLAFACITGSLLTSYNKARAGMERPISNVAWPDLFERLERIVTLCAGLLLSALVPHLGGVSLITLTLLIIALFTHVTAVQRFFRARALLFGPSVANPASELRQEALDVVHVDRAEHR
jgi:archaetidylinositol phosphate synthase